MKKKQLLHFQRSITHTEIYNDSDIDIDIFMVLCLQLVGRGLIGKAGAQHVLPNELGEENNFQRLIKFIFTVALFRIDLD